MLWSVHLSFCSRPGRFGNRLRPEAGGIAAVGRHYLYGIRAWGSLHVRRHAQGEGFTLTNDPKARRAELAIREYALRNETLILQVLAKSMSRCEERTLESP